MWTDSSDGMISSLASAELPNNQSMCLGHQQRKGDAKKFECFVEKHLIFDILEGCKSICPGKISENC